MGCVLCRFERRRFISREKKTHTNTRWTFSHRRIYRLLWVRSTRFDFISLEFKVKNINTQRRSRAHIIKTHHVCRLYVSNANEFRSICDCMWRHSGTQYWMKTFRRECSVNARRRFCHDLFVRRKIYGIAVPVPSRQLLPERKFYHP